jgi:hypothetical protein
VILLGWGVGCRLRDVMAIDDFDFQTRLGQGMQSLKLDMRLGDQMQVQAYIL